MYTELRDSGLSNKQLAMLLILNTVNLLIIGGNLYIGIRAYKLYKQYSGYKINGKLLDDIYNGKLIDLLYNMYLTIFPTSIQIVVFLSVLLRYRIRGQSVYYAHIFNRNVLINSGILQFICLVVFAIVYGKFTAMSSKDIEDWNSVDVEIVHVVQETLVPIITISVYVVLFILHTLWW